MKNLIRFLSELKSTPEKPGDKTIEHLLKKGTFIDKRYGQFEIPAKTLHKLKANFDSKVYGQKIFLDVAHKPQDGAAAEIVEIKILNDSIMQIMLEWYQHGIDALRKRGLQYLSAEYIEDYQDNETGEYHGPVLLGAAMTLRPVIKRLRPITLSTDIDCNHELVDTPVYDHLLEIGNAIMKDLATRKNEITQVLKAKKFSDEQITSFLSSFEQATELVGEDEKRLDELQKRMLHSYTLLMSSNDTPPAMELSVNGLTKEDVAKILAEHDKKKAEEAKTLADAQTAARKLFLDEIEEGIKDQPEEIRNTVLLAADSITHELSSAQIKQLAAQQLKMLSIMSVGQQLSDLGFRRGSAQSITVDDSNSVKKLQEHVDKVLGITAAPDSRRFAAVNGQLPEANKLFAEKVLKVFDENNARRLYAEAKLLAAGDTLVSDTAIPAAFERAVIREALYTLTATSFLDVATEVFAASHVVHYSYRDLTAAGRSDTRVYEGQPIAKAQMIQANETAYPLPQKLSVQVSDEVQNLVNAMRLDYDQVADNARNAERIIREDIDKTAFDETLQACDEYSAVTVTNENLELQADGTDKVFILANFPVVRPRIVRDLQGNQVGSTANAITVTYDSVARQEYDGTGTQTAGTYYVLNYNLGEIYLVDESGAIQTPADGTAYTISYNYSTNVYNFNTDLGGALEKVHWDTFLYRFGTRKTVLESERYHMPNFATMSGVIRDQVEQAEKFAANFQVPGTSLDTNGNVGRIKDVPCFKTAAPGLWSADSRIILGERGLTRFRITQPWTMGPLENQVDSNGKFTGQKHAYGTQFIVMHTPTQLKRGYTSINLYSATARVARATP